MDQERSAVDPPERPGVVGRIPPAALLDLHRLATLREVARCGSYAAAADSLCFTPSAVSQQMTGLARDLGFKLFERTPRGMRLTTAADVLARRLDGVFAQLNQAQGELEAVAAGAHGRLRLGSFPTATAAFVAATVGVFQDRFPAIEVSLADGEPHESVARLKERIVDLATVFDFDHWALSSDFDGRLTCQDSEITCVGLFDDRFVVVLPSGHRLAALQRLRVADLAGERILAGPAGCSPWGPDLREACRRAGFEADVESRYRTVDFAALQAVVATGRGITLVPELALRVRTPGTTTRPLLDGPVRHVSIATLAGVAHTPAVSAMVELLEQTAATRGDRSRPLARLS